MKQDNSLAVAFFALVMGGTVAWAIASDVAAPICSAFKLASQKADKPYLGCLEFWFERYQASIAAIIGAGVALAVLRPAFLQIQFLKRESTARMKEIVEQSARSLEGERPMIRDIRDLMREAKSLLYIYRETDWAQSYRSWDDPEERFRSGIDRVLLALLENEAKFGSDGQVGELRSKMADGLNRLRAAIGQLTLAFISGTTGLDPEYFEDFTGPQMDAARDEAVASFEGLEDIISSFVIKHDAEIRESWTRARDLAKLAYD